MSLTVVVNQQFHGQDVVNVLRYDGADAIKSFAPEITDSIAQSLIDHVQDRMSSNWSMSSCTFYDPADPPGAPGLETFPTQGTITGTGSAAGLSTTTALLISYVCNGGPPFRGRIYMGGLQQAELVAGGLWGNGTVAAFAAYAADLLTVSGSGLADISQVIESKGTNTVPAGTRSPITGLVVRPVPATQRRRRIGVGS